MKARYAQVAKFFNIMESFVNVEIKAVKNAKTISVKKGDPKPYKPHTYLMSKFVDIWTQSHEGGKCYGSMTTNIFECFNDVLKSARDLM